MFQCSDVHVDLRNTTQVFVIAERFSLTKHLVFLLYKWLV